MSKAKMGRPPTPIDQHQFESLCGLQCTEEEICGWFGISVDTLERWCKDTYKKTFAEVFQEKRGAGKISLRRSQWRLAEKSAAMAIFLGKQYLGQKDAIDDTAEKEAIGRLDEILQEMRKE